MSKTVYVFTGGKGVGKSTAMATYPKVDEMGQVIVFDTEDSMSEIVKILDDQGRPFGQYIRAQDRFPGTYDDQARMIDKINKGDNPWVDEAERRSLVEYYEFFVRSIAAATNKQTYKILIIDTIEPLEMAMTAAVDINPKRFGWSGVSAFGRMETEGVRPLYYNLLEAIHKTGVETILISSHIKQSWVDKRPVPGKVRPGGRLKVLSLLSTAMFWLVMEPNNADGAPAAVVLKARPGKWEIGEDGRWTPRRVLPERIPHFSWRDIEYYMENPADYTSPKPGEVMSRDERDMISELLTDAQMRYMILGAKADSARYGFKSAAQQAENDPIDVELDPQVKAVMDLYRSGKDVNEIAKELGLPPVLVKGMIS